MTITLIILGVVVAVAIVVIAGGFYILYRMTNDDELVTELTEEQADQRLDEIARELER